MKSDDLGTVGAITNDTDFSAAPLDARYQYIGGAAPDPVSCKSRPTCGGWWACWQWNELPPGSQYPTQVIRDAADQHRHGRRQPLQQDHQTVERGRGTDPLKRMERGIAWLWRDKA